MSRKELLKRMFPAIDDELSSYINDVLEGEELSSADDVYEAVGDYLQALTGAGNDDAVREFCRQISQFTIGQKEKTAIDSGGDVKKLATPIHLREIAEEQEVRIAEEEKTHSIALVQKDIAYKINRKKLDKANVKLENKREKRSRVDTISPHSNSSNDGASVSQTFSRRNDRMESKGTNKCKDIRIENFDVAYGEKLLIKDSSLLLVAGRRYGLVGRNGLGKTTLLRMLSSNQLKIPSHISVLHVEQEVVGDDTLALQSVLECDTLRESLLKEEADIVGRLSSDNDPELQVRLNEIYAQLLAIEADKAPSRASVILSGLGFSVAMQRQETKLFSGGWRMRLALARALFSKPDLLLLDEPTNMLDIKAILWLESYLQAWTTTLLFVSHDRKFLNVVPTDILHLHSRRIDYYRGIYDNFVKTMTEKLKNQQREYEAQQLHRAHVKEFIDKYRALNSTAALVQSKIKLLEKLPELHRVEKEKKVTFSFPETESLSPPILQLDDVNFHYVLRRSIFCNVCVSANMESRICIVGENGTGKSTLLKILLGELSPVTGIRHVHRNLRIGYFRQHHVDQLDVNVSSIEFLALKFPGRPNEEYRRQLGSFGISGDLALQQIDTLSGGQKSRVAFAIMCMKRPNFLILDEPTNHLDVETIEALANAINKFTGGVILVAHDEQLIRSVCRELWVCRNERVVHLEGGFDEYRAIVQQEFTERAR